MTFKECALSVVIVTILWVGLFALNRSLFSIAEVNPFVSWIFLPAALRMVAVMLVRWSAAVGLMFGGLITAILFYDEPLTALWPLTLISGFGPMLALMLGSRLMGVSQSLQGLKAGHLWGYAFLGAAFNAIGSQTYLQFIHPSPEPMAVIAKMFLGDIVGSVLVLLIMSTVLSRGSTHRSSRE